MKKLKSLERLQDSFAKLPSIGKKSAERLAYSIMEMDKADVIEFSDSLIAVKERIKICPICGNYTENDLCDICSNKNRDQKIMMVVSFAKDVIAFEQMGTFNGLYHVLGGAFSTHGGKSLDDLNIPSLIDRIKNGSFEEVIIATNPTIEGETTAIYISKLLKDYIKNITRLAYGLQMGGTLDYTDSLTLSKAIEGRRKI